MGTQLQAADLTLDDFRGLEGCNEILNETRPDVLETIHRNYFEAGADAVETNTFGCNLSNLGDYDIADRIRDLSQKGTAIARRVADELGSPDRKRYVLGSTGAGHQAADSGPHRIRGDPRRLHRGRAGHAGRRSRRHPGGNLPGPTAAEGGGVGVAAGDDAGRAAHSGVCPRHRRDHRHHAAGQRDRGGVDRCRAARCGHDRLELRDGSGRDERAPAPPVPARPHPGVGDAQRRVAGAGRQGRRISVAARRIGRGAGRLHRRVRALAGRWLLRHHPGPYPRSGCRGCEHQASRATGQLRAVGVVAVHRNPVRPGRLGSGDRGANERQRLQGFS